MLKNAAQHGFIYNLSTHTHAELSSEDDSAKELERVRNITLDRSGSSVIVLVRRVLWAPVALTAISYDFLHF
jgi:hypothetical protein